MPSSISFCMAFCTASVVWEFALFDGDGVRHFIEVLAELFQLTIGLGNGIADNRGIGEEDVGLAGHHSGGGVGLLLGGLDGDVFLAVRLALLGRSC